MTPSQNTVALHAIPGSLPVNPSDGAGATARGLRPIELSARLQTTLEVEPLMRLFASELAGEVRFDQLDYEHDNLGIQMREGTGGRHRCEYRLEIEHDDLGVLRLQRQRRFTSSEVERLENLLCGLVYPLRNALLYRRALRAAVHDGLTGCLNRTAFDLALGREIALARRNGTPLAMLAMDIDHFKGINDTHGHAGGDSVLRAFADIARDSIRETDQLFRVGGEEFVVLLSNTPRTGALCVAERIRQHTAELAIATERGTIRCTVSSGLTLLTPDDSGASFYARADQALYAAKRAGRDRVVSVAEDIAIPA